MISVVASVAMSVALVFGVVNCDPTSTPSPARVDPTQCDPTLDEGCVPPTTVTPPACDPTLPPVDPTVDPTR